MKKILAIVMALVLMFSMTALAESAAKGEGVMTYAEYAAAEMETEVTVETYVQAKQSWWNDQATLYTVDQDGGYFLYNLPCTAEQYAQLVPGTKIKVTGYKTAWAGEVEIVDAKFEILEGSYIAQPTDVTALLADEALIEHQNKLVAFKGMTVEAVNEAGDAFQYNWDGSGEAGSDSDLYFKASVDGQTYTFVIEYYMCDANGVYGAETKAYKAVQALKVGDKIDMTGFLYWYEGAQPHIASVAEAKGEGVMTYAEYAAAELETEVTVETYVQAKQSWWNDQATLYTVDQMGGYFLYNLPCTAEQYAQLVPGTKIKVTGYKTAWAGEVEIVDAKFEILEGSYIAEATDVTALLASENLIDAQNQLVAFKGMTVEAVNEAGDAFQYNWDGSGEAGSDSDLYFKASVDGQTYTFVIEYYMCDANGVYGAETAAYQAVQSLKVGDKIDMTGFLYWYEGAQPHIASVAAAE